MKNLPTNVREVQALVGQTAGVPFGTPGSTNLLHVVTLTVDELKGREG